MQSAPDRRPSVRLVMVTDTNHNKVYEMAENGDGTFTAHFGRIGARLQTRTYPVARWSATYREKTRKGYTDVTSLAAAAEVRGFDVADPSIAAFVDRLQRAADAALSAQYLVAPTDVSVRMVASAQSVLDALGGLAGQLRESPGDATLVAAFDAGLLELYRTIPRKMSDVRTHLLGERLDPAAVPALLTTEQDALDRMAQRVRLGGATKPPTLLDALGVDLQPASATDLARIRRAMGPEASKLLKAVRVHHPAQQARFEAHVTASRSRATELLWHGSRSENWLSILETGLQLHPARAVVTGKMFGYGLYFATSFAKSLGYTSHWNAVWTGGRAERGVLALCDVHVGRALKVRRYAPWCGDLTAERLALRGSWRPYDALWAKAGPMLRHDEIVVYRESQVCPRFLIEVGDA